MEAADADANTEITDVNKDAAYDFYEETLEWLNNPTEISGRQHNEYDASNCKFQAGKWVACIKEIRNEYEYEDEDARLIKLFRKLKCTGHNPNEKYKKGLYLFIVWFELFDTTPPTTLKEIAAQLGVATAFARYRGLTMQKCIENAEEKRKNPKRHKAFLQSHKSPVSLYTKILLL